jgi:hypothetical protein
MYLSTSNTESSMKTEETCGVLIQINVSAWRNVREFCNHTHLTDVGALASATGQPEQIVFAVRMERAT